MHQVNPVKGIKRGLKSTSKLCLKNEIIKKLIATINKTFVRRQIIKS